MTTHAHQNSTIEPPWAGIERTLSNAAFWAALTFIIIPVPLSALLCGLWWLVTGTFGNFLICYAIAILTGSIPFLKKMDKAGKIYKVIKSQEVMIITNDLPASQDREASDSREETPLHGFKLGEGMHIISPFDQEFATMKIEIEYQVQIEPFRVTIGSNHMLDLEIKSAVADLKTDSEHLLALARIDTDEDERKKKVQNRMKAFIKRFIEEECKEASKGGVDPDNKPIYVDPAEKSSEISNKVQGRIEALLLAQFPGFELKSFTIGNIDKPAAVETARDKAATYQEMTQAAENALIKLNNVPGIPEGGKMTPQQAMTDALVAAELKKANISGFTMDPGTIAALGSVAVAIVTALKSNNTPTPPTS